MAITTNDNLQNNSGKSLDNKYLKSGLFVYASVAEAQTLVLQAYRSRGLTVLIDDGGIATEYWWRDGTSDVQLIKKNSATTVNKDDFTLTGNGSRTVIGDIVYIRVKPTSELTGFKVGKTLNAEDVIGTVTVPAGVWSSYIIALYFETNTTLYFGGVTSSTDIAIVSI